ncbi:multidrug resistance-associated protein 1 [Pelomyxa schiedti]|nr:multidrug resistance-associated protein 1 [Pelomyxa schiedti]
MTFRLHGHRGKKKTPSSHNWSCLAGAVVFILVSLAVATSTAEKTGDPARPNAQPEIKKFDAAPNSVSSSYSDSASSYSSESSSASCCSYGTEFTAFWCDGDEWGPWDREACAFTACFDALLLTALRVVAFPLLIGRYVQAIWHKRFGERKGSIKYRVQTACCCILVFLYFVEVVGLLIISFPTLPEMYLLISSIVGVLVWIFAVFVMAEERTKFMPHNWILRGWWISELFISSVQLPTVIQESKSDTIGLDGWILVLVLFTELILCFLLLFSQQATLYSPLPESDALKREEKTPDKPGYLPPPVQHSTPYLQHNRTPSRSSLSFPTSKPLGESETTPLLSGTTTPATVGLVTDVASADEMGALVGSTPDTSHAAALTGPGLSLALERPILQPEDLDSNSVILLSPEQDPDNVNPFSYLTFRFIKRILNLRSVYKHRPKMEMSDLGDLASRDTARVLSRSFHHLWAEECAVTEHPAMIKVFRKMFLSQFVSAGIWRFLYVIFEFAPPLAMFWILQYVGKDESGFIPGLVCTCFVYICSVAGLLLQHLFLYKTYRIGQNVRTCVITSVYRKCFKLSNLALSQYPLEVICSYMVVDAPSLCEAVPSLHLLWICPLEICVSLALLIWIIGWPSLIGVLLIVLSIPFNLAFLRFMQQNKFSMLNFKDTRGNLLKEILQAIKTVKLMVWEAHFQGALNKARDTEVKYLFRSLIWRSMMQTITWATPALVGLVTYACYIGNSEDLTAVVAFTTMAVFNVIRFPIVKLPRVVAEFLQSKSTLERITTFLLAPELDPENRKEVFSSPPVHTPAVLIKEGLFQWEDTGTVALSDINFIAQPGQLIAIIGSPACGKTTLLRSVMGDLKRMNGDVVVYGKIAYTDQQPWIQTLTLRENILFGKPYHEPLYEAVVSSCELKCDFSTIAGGDTSEIGEQGVSLSDGQMQKISLARAAYQNADVYLLDDTLSSVDPTAGEKIFTNCICGLLKGKTRIFVTHQLQYLNRADVIFVMKQGTIVEAGTFEELTKLDFSEFTNLFANYEAAESVPTTEEKASDLDAYTKDINQGLMDLIVTEEGAKGHVPLSVYGLYMKESGFVVSVVTLLLFILSTTGLVTSVFWLSKWTSSIESNSLTFTNGEYLAIYAAIIIVSVSCILLRFLVLSKATTNSSVSIHTKALKRVLQAPMSFFYSTPVGRMLNRFSEDLLTLDDKVNFSLGMLIGTIFSVLAAIGSVCYVNPFFLPIIFPLVYLYIHTQQWYLVYARELFRLDAVSKSPLYSTIPETIRGIKTIRCMKENLRFIFDVDRKLDSHQKVFYAICVANRWLGVRIEFVASTAIALVFLLCTLQKDNLNPSIIASSIAFALQLPSLLVMLIQCTTEVESQMVSLQRLREYLDIPQEFPFHDTEAQSIPPPEWPAYGHVEFIGYTLQYRPTLLPALENLSFAVNPGEKIGVVGRSGAGKSSLMVALFRLEEASQGKIEIDGLDISSISLERLRSKLCAIPQDPVLFCGTLRSNLDVLGQFNDQQMIEVLETVNLRDLLATKDNGLDCEVIEGGANFSVGERQLICLARGLLLRSTVMLLDEATANVDVETEEKIHSVVFEQCRSSTMFIIAHRTHTILQCDRVMMIERGSIVGLGPPKQLMSTNPAFSSFIKKAVLKD